MRLLPDTHLLLCSSGDPSRLRPEALHLLDDPSNEVFFSAVSIWETAIKHARGRPDFVSDPRVLRNGLLTHGYRELTVTSEHALGVSTLPPFHKDPFDRLLIAQAWIEGLTLLTQDDTILRYPGDIRRV
jgi:PIN domain nuclease of toxin-antitoxin system